MKILINGLCLSRNLGGPAMGLTMIEELGRRIPGADFKFVVHRERLEAERPWAEKWGIEIVPRLQYLSRYKLAAQRVTGLVGLKSADHELKMEQYRDYVAAIKEADVILNNEGIAYVGDGVRKAIVALFEHSSFQYARAFKRPYCRFIQSYGPFDDWRVRFLAKREFKKLPFVLARGASCAEECRRIVAAEKVRCVPDSAVLLKPSGAEDAQPYLPEGFSPGEYFILSPSAVIRRSVLRDVPGSIGDRHVESVAMLAERLIERGERVLFLPHMYSDVAAECDGEVCREVIARLPDDAPVGMVDTGFGPREAKWIIANSRGGVVSRYHALVAAISTAKPVVTIGWNVKYRDLLDFYGVPEMAVDARSFEPAGLVDEVLGKLDAFDAGLLEKVAAAQEPAARRVNEAIDELADWMKSL